VLIAEAHWGTYQTAESLRVPHHPRFDGLLGHGAIGVSTCRRASRLTGGGVNAGSENDGNFAPGGVGISVNLRGIRGCAWALLWFSWCRRVGDWGIDRTNGNVDRVSGDRTSGTLARSKDSSPLGHFISSPKAIDITELTAITLGDIDRLRPRF
jgi:hypothetical protein